MVQIAIMNVNAILGTFKKQVQNLYGDNFERLILYGSYARGDYQKKSDIDIMVLVNSKDDEKDELLSDLAYSFLLKNEVLIHAMPTLISEYENFWNPLYINIKKEGTTI